MARYQLSYKDQKRDEDDSEGKLFVGGLAWESNEDSIKSYFEKYGSVDAVNLKRNKEDATKHRGFAFVKFVHAEDAEAVLNQIEPHFIDGSKVDPKSACPIGIKPEQRTKKIFVGGLQGETTEEKLMEYFGQFGEIKSNIEFAVDHNTKKRRGFCFIEFANEGIVDRIVKDKYHEVAGKRLEAKRALSKQQQVEASIVNPIGRGGRGAPVGNPYGGGYGMQSGAASPYQPYQPVIYIHPDSLASGYPVSTFGVGCGYSSGVGTMYNPYSGGRNNPKPATTTGGMKGASVPRYIPFD